MAELCLPWGTEQPPLFATVPDSLPLIDLSSNGFNAQQVFLGGSHVNGFPNLGENF